MKTESHIKDIADAIAEENSEFVERGFAEAELVQAIKQNFAVYEAQEGLTASDKYGIFTSLYDNDLFNTVDLAEQGAVSILELRTMMQLCGITTYTVTI